MGIMEQLAAEKKAAQDILAKGMENITEDEQKQLDTHTENAKSLSDRIKRFNAASDSMDHISVQSKKAPVKQAKTLGELYVQELAAKGLTVLETKTHPFQTSEFKAATDTHIVGDDTGAYGPYVTDVDQNGVWGNEYALTVANLFSAGTISGNSIKYPVYGALEGGAKTVKEAAQKPQLHLPDPEWKVDSLTEVAAYWKISDDMAEDTPYVVSEIQQHSTYNLLLQEEMQMLSGAGANADLKGILNRGIQAIAKGTDSDPDRIFHATTLISNATGFPADAIVINPVDYEALRLAKDGNQQYYGGGFFSGQYGQGGVLQNPALWGLRTVVTPSIPAGTVLVGAFKAGGMVFRKGGLRVESTNSNENDFTNDKITFRIKERLGLQVKYPDAFVSVALGLKTGA